jgi:hypothetical protein
MVFSQFKKNLIKPFIALAIMFVFAQPANVMGVNFGWLHPALGKQHEAITLKECSKEQKEAYQGFLEKTDKIVFIYFPGTLGNGAIAGRYTTQSMHLGTGETITSKNGLQLFGKHIATINGGETINMPKELSLSWKPKSWVAYAWHKGGSNITRRYNQSYGIAIEKSQVETDAEYSINGHTINPFNYSLGFGGEKQAVIDVFNSVVAKYPGKDIVFFGDSRGSSAIMNAVPELQQCAGFDRVKAIILESCFDTAEHVYARQAVSKVVSFDVANWLSKRFLNVDHLANKPCEVAKNIASETFPPVLMVTSKTDERVPHELTMANHTAWKKVLGDKLSLIVLENSRHIYYAADNEQDRKTYFEGVHAFYEKCGLPYISTVVSE